MPSLRARVLRHALVAGLWTLRRVGAGGVPAPDAPPAVLNAYLLRLRTAVAGSLDRLPVGRDVTVTALSGTPFGGLVVAPTALGPPPTDGPGLREWLAARPRVLLHLHGGAYLLGSSRSHRALVAPLARATDAPVVLPDYRLAPEHPYPAAVDDVEAAWRWLTAAGVAPERIALTGDSAGGGLAAALLLRLRDQGEPLPACYVGMSPWLDLEGTGASLEELAAVDPWLSPELLPLAARAYAGSTPLDHPEISPLCGALEGLPPVLLHVGGDEVLRDDTLRFVARARAAGVDASAGVTPGLWHVFVLFPGLPEAEHARAEIAAFCRRHIPDRPGS